MSFPTRRSLGRIRKGPVIDLPWSYDDEQPGSGYLSEDIVNIS